jgi:peptide/nickel transport system substrate-binding protein
MILSATYLSTAPRNESKFGTDKLDRLIKDARSELDEDRRQDMYSEIQRILNKDGGRIIPAFAQDVMAMRDYVGTDGQYGGGWVMDGGHFAKRWWLK